MDDRLQILLYLSNLTSATVKWRHKRTNLVGSLVVRNQAIYAKYLLHIFGTRVPNKCFLLVLPLLFYKNLHLILTSYEM